LEIICRREISKCAGKIHLLGTKDDAVFKNLRKERIFKNKVQDNGLVNFKIFDKRVILNNCSLTRV
jgi:hypothetical protein